MSPASIASGLATVTLGLALATVTVTVPCEAAWVAEPRYFTTRVWVPTSRDLAASAMLAEPPDRVAWPSLVAPSYSSTVPVAAAGAT